MVLQHLGLEPLLTAFLTLPAVGGKYAVNFRAGALSGVSLYLVAVRGPARSGGARAFAAVIVAGVGWAISAHVHDKPFRYVVTAAGSPGYCRWLYLYLLTHTGRFYRRSWISPPGYFIGNMVYFPAGGDWQYADGGGIHHGADCVLIALYLAFVETSERSMHSEAHRFPQTGGLGRRGFLHFPILIIAAYAFNTEDAAFGFPTAGPDAALV